MIVAYEPMERKILGIWFTYEKKNVHLVKRYG